jgi:hypothetical protein
MKIVFYPTKIVFDHVLPDNFGTLIMILEVFGGSKGVLSQQLQMGLQSLNLHVVLDTLVHQSG